MSILEGGAVFCETAAMSKDGGKFEGALSAVGRPDGQLFPLQ